MTDEAKQDAAYYRSLTRKIVLIMVVVSIVPLILITGTIRGFFLSSYEEKVVEHLKVLVKKHSERIDSFLSERLANIQVQADSYSFEQLSDESFLQKRLMILQKDYSKSFTDLGVVDERGIQVAYTGPFELKRANYADAPWFKEAIGQETHISDVFPGLRGIPHFIVAVREEQDEVKWLLRSTVDFDRFNSLVESVRIGETGFAFILNRKGEFQTKPHADIRVNKERYLSILAAGWDTDQKLGEIEGGAGSGSSLIYVMQKLKGGNWVLVFQQSEQDAYAALYKARRIAFVILVVGLVVIVAAALVLSQRVVSRIRVADLEKEKMTEKVIEAGKLASLGELAAGIAHEINNPLAVMVEEAGWMQDLLDDAGPNEAAPREEFQRSLDQIKTQGNRCKQITHKLLSFARKTDPIPRKTQLNDVVREVIALGQQRLLSGSIRILGVLGSDLPLVRISPAEAQQVFMNLLNNAVDAVEPRGGFVRVITRKDGDHVVVDVEDNGPGIPRAIIPRIFDPFFTTKPVGKGTGLGLSICYGIVKKMGGDITVNTAEGAGTTFHVKFRACKPKQTKE